MTLGPDPRTSKPQSLNQSQEANANNILGLIYQQELAALRQSV